MSYVDRILEPGEQLRYRSTVSWTIYFPGALVGAAALASVYLRYESGADALWLLAVPLGVVALVTLARGLFVRVSTEIAITDRRIVFKRGFVRRHTVEMNMAKVESVDVDQTLVGRLFDYGDVTVRGIGSTFERLTFIDAPLKLRTTVTAG